MAASRAGNVGFPNRRGTFVQLWSNVCRSAVDDPTTCFYAQLAERYPDAKVVLTHRDPERWFNSTQSALAAMLESLKNETPEVKPLNDLLAPMGWDPRDPRTRDREHMLNWFQSHMAKTGEVPQRDS